MTAELVGSTVAPGPALSPVYKPARMVGRGTSNGNERGSSEDRKRRKLYLVQTYRADKDLSSFSISDPNRPWLPPRHTEVPLYSGEPACRCYRCGKLLSVETVTVDRIVPGCEGGTYRRNNIRPACGTCNSSTGQKLSIERRKGKR